MALLTQAALADPVPDSVVSDQDKLGNLIRLAVYLEGLSGTAQGETADLIDNLRSASAERVRESLRSLIPELAAHHVLRRSFARPRLRRDDDVHAASVSSFVHWLNSDGEYQSTTGLWLQGFSDSSEQNDRDDVNGFESDSRGFTLGFDRSVADGVALGIMFSRVDTEVDSNRFGRDDVTVDEYSAYTAFFWGRQYFSMNLAYSDNVTDRLRPIIIPILDVPVVVPLASEITSKQWATSASYGFTLSRRGWRFGPFASLAYAELTTDDYVERSTRELSFIVETDTEETLIAGVGFGLGYDYLGDSWIVAPSFQLAVERDLKADPTTSFSTIRGTAFGFDSSGYSIEETRVRYGVGLNLIHISGFSASIYYDAERKNDYSYQAGIIGVQYDF